MTATASSTAPDTAWTRYLRQLTGTTNTSAIGTRSGVDQSSVWRWLTEGKRPSAPAAVAVARAFGGNPVEALAASGYITTAEAGMEPTDWITALPHAPLPALLAEVGRRSTAA